MAKAHGLAFGLLVITARVICQPVSKANRGSLGVGGWTQEDLELHWTAGDGRVLCGSEDFVSVTSYREVFDEHERARLTCHRCAQLLHP
jgi:hypothetical protein